MTAVPETFLDGRVTLHAGDCVEVMASLPEASVDAVVTDPPYELGFMGKSWDSTGVAFAPATWAAVKRVLKPGGHLLAFSAPRCVHRMAVAIEDAGFEIRDRTLGLVAADAAVMAFLKTLSEAQQQAFLDCIERSGFGGELAWVFGSGFPKSHNVERAIAVTTCRLPGRHFKSALPPEKDCKPDDHICPATPESQPWDGWGTALKPAYEPIIMARKPLAKDTVAGQVLATGTGGINAGVCAIGADGGTRTVVGDRKNQTVHALGNGLGAQGGAIESSGKGRWPANLVHDGSPEVVDGFPSEAGGGNGEPAFVGRIGIPGEEGKAKGALVGTYADSGSAARFYYTAKADGDDRLGSRHPTVKPVDLMQWLVRLVCPKGGTVLDPFAGTGTTGEAAFREGMNAVLIEREAEYRADIARRMKLAFAGERERKAARAEVKGIPAIEESPLFGGGGQ